jgi:hypothetical protein
MSVFEVPRPDLERALLEGASQRAALLLVGPPGAGKTRLLLRTAEALRRQGWIAVYLDLMGAASSPERFVRAALGALPAETFGAHIARATEIRRLIEQDRVRSAAAVEALFGLWAALDHAGPRPVALLIDEATEIRSLAYFAGLREAHKPFAAALASRRRGTLLATSFPTLARRMWKLETLEAAPLSETEVRPALPRGVDAAELLRASSGWPRHVAVLVERLSAGASLERAWTEEMAPGGRLESACRYTYESLLLRSRGYGMSKAVLAAVAEEEGLNLTALVRRIGRTPGAVRDYLQWLVGVDALRMTRKRYHYVDGLVRWWVRLHARGVPPSREELASAARQAMAPKEAAASAREPLAARKGEPRTPATAEPEPSRTGTADVATVETPAAVRHDSLMEID